MNQLPEKTKMDWIDEEFDFSKSMKCDPEYDFMMHEEALETSWKKMRERVARETGQNPSDTMRYCPPKKECA